MVCFHVTRGAFALGLLLTFFTFIAVAAAPTFYDVLEVKKSCSTQEVKKVRRLWVKVILDSWPSSGQQRAPKPQDTW